MHGEGAQAAFSSVQDFHRNQPAMKPSANNDERFDQVVNNRPLVPTGVLDFINSFDAKPAEKDPTGKSQHEPGAKVDAGKLRYGLVLSGFAHALRAVTRVGTLGAAKYSDYGFLKVPNGFDRYEDAQGRHQFQRHCGELLDPESNELHLTHEAWNALAKLELFLREEAKKAPQS